MVPIQQEQAYGCTLHTSTNTLFRELIVTVRLVACLVFLEAIYKYADDIVQRMQYGLLLCIYTNPACYIASLRIRCCIIKVSRSRLMQAHAFIQLLSNYFIVVIVESSSTISTVCHFLISTTYYSYLYSKGKYKTYT